MNQKLDWNYERYRTRDRLIEYDFDLIAPFPHSAGLPIIYPWENVFIEQLKNMKLSDFELVESINEEPSAILKGNLISNELINGKGIIYITKIMPPEENQYIQLTYSNGKETPVYPLYTFNNIYSKISYPPNTALFLIYYNDAFYIVNPVSITI